MNEFFIFAMGLKVEEKWDKLLNPHKNDISEMFLVPAPRSFFAFSIRILIDSPWRQSCDFFKNPDEMGF